MKEITEFHIAASHTINLGNYSSFKVEAGITVNVNEGADFEALKLNAQAALKNLLRETYRAQERKEKTA